MENKSVKPVHPAEFPDYKTSVDIAILVVFL